MRLRPPPLRPDRYRVGRAGITERLNLAVERECAALAFEIWSTLKPSSAWRRRTSIRPAEAGGSVQGGGLAQPRMRLVLRASADGAGGSPLEDAQHRAASSAGLARSSGAGPGRHRPGVSDGDCGAGATRPPRRGGIRDLDRVGHALRDRPGVLSRAVTTGAASGPDDFDAGMAAELCRDGCRRPVRQQIDWTPRLQVDQDRAPRSPFAPRRRRRRRRVVGAEYARRACASAELTIL